MDVAMAFTTNRNLFPIQRCHDSCEAFSMLVGHFPDVPYVMHCDLLISVANTARPT
jgi:hypothetical protein